MLFTNKPMARAAVAAVLSLCSLGAWANTVTSNNGAASATLSIQNNWGGGYCASVTISNQGSASISSWQTQLNLNNSQISNLWSGLLGGTQVTGMGYNSEIAVGASVSYGFCANTTQSSNNLPTLISLSVAGGGTGASSSSAVSSSSTPGSSSVSSSSSLPSSSNSSSSSITSSSSSSLVSSSSSIASSSSSLGQCASSCNWYGSLYPLCQQTASGWGWENSQSCIAASTCNSQSGNGGVVANCGSSSSVASSSSSHISSSSVSSSSLSSSSLSSSSVSSSSSSSASGLIPNATSTGWPYCRSADSDPDGDGWGWENSYSCIVYGSAPDSGPGNFSYCAIGSAKLDLCTTDTGSWGNNSGQICLSRSMCPGMGSASQAPMRSAPVNANADSKTRAVYTYLNSIWGSKMLSGQQDLTWQDNIDQYQRVINDTGRAPAIMGYDYMNYGLWAGNPGLAQTEEAIAHWNRGGLVTFAWHWRDPNASNSTIGEFYTERTNFTIPIRNGELDTTSSSFANIEADVALIAAELQKLENAGVPVLWRPLHEASGGWFWWGRSDRTDGVPPAYAQVVLWRYLYNRLTNHYGLNNLIWVWNGQSAAWYPGDAYVDIVSHDIYDGSRNYESQASVYNLAKNYSQQVKMVALSENSNIPDPDLMRADNAWWLYFVVWNDTDTAEGVTSSNNFWTGEYYNTNAHKRHVYNHELVITLDELPAF